MALPECIDSSLQIGTVYFYWNVFKEAQDGQLLVLVLQHTHNTVLSQVINFIASSDFFCPHKKLYTCICSSCRHLAILLGDTFCLATQRLCADDESVIIKYHMSHIHVTIIFTDLGLFSQYTELNNSMYF